MRRLVERSAARILDSAMCGSMNFLQWKRRGDASTPAELEAYLAAHAASSRHEFYRLTPVVHPVIRGEWMTWESPIPSGYPENDRARIRFFPAARRDAPVAILLHALMSASDAGYVRLARWFNRHGWSAAFPHLPYHYSRTPKNTLNGELAMSANLIRNAEGLRQGVVELRQLMALLRARGVRQFGLVGTSYGGWTGALLSFLEPDLRFVSLIQPIVNVERAIWENPASATLRCSLARLGHRPGNTLRHAHLSSPLHGVPMADHVFLTAGEFDRVAPPADLEAAAAAWPGARLLQVRQGHFGYRALPAALQAITPLLASSGRLFNNSCIERPTPVGSVA
ncbi:MAG: hypothetical protein SFU53_01055 [Terrimicrobiaceae bacterium]|nr:hypothetical protein [Terrimicrobiaceae bacterium]